MPEDSSPEKLPLPKRWPRCARSAVLHVISLATTALTYVRGWCANSPIQRVRLRTKNDRLKAEVAMFEEEMRIKDRRMSAISPHRRPYYLPTERMAILELKCQRGWSKAQAGQRFLVEPQTIASWMKRLDEEGPPALVQLPGPVNRFPEFVRYVVKRLKTLCPAMGKRKIAETLARAGLHLAATTAHRMLKAFYPEPPAEEALPSNEGPEDIDEATCRMVTSKRPDHVWSVDLTIVPTKRGFWTMLSPFSWAQAWPFARWVAIAIDHFSRRVVGFAVFLKEPSSLDVRRFLGRAIGLAGAVPKYIICDRGPQFDCPGFRRWCKRRKLKPRFGAVGKYGSIAVVERFIRSMKDGCFRRILVPMRLQAMREELALYVRWHNEHRPNTALKGRTPNEVYFNRTPANEQPRFEPRRKWPRRSLCASPQAKVKGRRDAQLELAVSYLEERKHLPVVEIRRAA